MPYMHLNTVILLYIIYIYIYIYVKMIDCGESDNMIEICGKLYKPKT